MTQRPPHRNPGKTAPTHVKSSAGLWRVHDGLKRNPDGSSRTVIDPATGKEMSGLTYDDARRMKDYAVTKLKLRTVGVVQDDSQEFVIQNNTFARPTSAPASIAIRRPAPTFSGEGNPDGLDLEMPDVPEIRSSAAAPKPVVIKPPTKPIVLRSTDTPNPDPELESLRQSALRAAAPAAREAQERADKIKRDRDALRAAGIDPDKVRPPKDPNHPKSVIVGLDPVDEEPTEDADVDGGEDVEVMMATGNKAQKDDAERAREQAALDAANAEAAGKALFEHERHPSSTRKWSELSEEQRAGIRWRALNESDVRIGDIVAYYAKGDGAAVAMHYAQIVRVFDRNTVNLQLGADPDRKTADGKMVLNVKRLEGDRPTPNAWAPYVASLQDVGGDELEANEADA